MSIRMPHTAARTASGAPAKRAPLGRAAAPPAKKIPKAKPAPGPNRGAMASGLLWVSAVITTVGLVMVLSSSSEYSLRRFGSSWVFFQRQAVWVAIGVVALVACSLIPYRWWQAKANLVLGSVVALLIVVLLPGIGRRINGSQRWLGVGQFGFQPSELAKLALVVFLADFLGRRRKYAGDSRRIVRPAFLVFVAVVGLVMLEPDMGTSLVLVAITFCMLWVGGAPLKSMGRILGTLVAGGWMLAIVEPYRWRRMTSFANPWADAGNTGFQASQGLVALGSGGLLGVGLGAGRAKLGFLPNAYTDFIFAIIGEELGLLGALLVVGLFVALAGIGLRIARTASDDFGQLLATGITAWLTGQAFINIGAVIGLLPVTGVPLPMVSLGGSSLVIVLGAIGILSNVARDGRRPDWPWNEGRARRQRAKSSAHPVFRSSHPSAASRRFGARSPRR